jgi:hypothetical protein
LCPAGRVVIPAVAIKGSCPVSVASAEVTNKPDSIATIAPRRTARRIDIFRLPDPRRTMTQRILFQSKVAVQNYT